MGARMAVFSTLISLGGVVGSGVISLIYNGTSMVLGCIILAMATLAFVINF